MRETQSMLGPNLVRRYQPTVHYRERGQYASKRDAVERSFHRSLDAKDHQAMVSAGSRRAFYERWLGRRLPDRQEFIDKTLDVVRSWPGQVAAGSFDEVCRNEH
mgnify:CR=1 FL=1